MVCDPLQRQSEAVVDARAECAAMRDVLDRKDAVRKHQPNVVNNFDRSCWPSPPAGSSSWRARRRGTTA